MLLLEKPSKDILKQYKALQTEIKDLDKRIQKLEQQSKTLYNERVVDVVSKGKKGNKSLGHVMIKGYPHQKIERRYSRIEQRKQKLEAMRDELDEMLILVEEYISKVNDSFIRQILRHRFIDGLEWRDVAKEIGGSNTGDGCRMACKRFFEEK